MPEADRNTQEALIGRMRFGSSGPRPKGIGFVLWLAYVDATNNPPSMSQFEREWVVSRSDLDRAEREGRVDRMLIEQREKQERSLLEHIERVLSESGTRLDFEGNELVMRRVN